LATCQPPSQGSLAEITKVNALIGIVQPTETIDIAGQPVPRRYGDVVEEFAAAHHGAIVALRNHEGRLRAIGRDRLDLLHRMSTNDLTSLAAGQARPTVLTTPIARIVDQIWVLNRGETVLCLTSPGRATAVRRWLAGFIFYNDQVKFEDTGAELGQLGLFGPGAAAVAEALMPGAAGLAENHFLDAGELVVLRGRPMAGDGYTVVAPMPRLEALWGAALAAGAVPAGEDAYQLLRLEAGLPGNPELTGDYIPLEANLWPAVDFHKGCYIGQEIIARMESRGKLARRLVGIKLAAPVAAGVEVRAHEGGPAAGTITSAGELPGYGPVGLAYLKTAQAEVGTQVTIGETSGEVVELPFYLGP
jgi:tRNA-modifying protein YgfZ